MAFRGRVQRDDTLLRRRGFRPLSARYLLEYTKRNEWWLRRVAVLSVLGLIGLLGALAWLGTWTGVTISWNQTCKDEIDMLRERIEQLEAGLSCEGFCSNGTEGTDGTDGICLEECVNGTNGTDGLCTEPCVNGTDGVCTEPCVNGTTGADGLDGNCTGLCVNGTDGVCTEPCVNGTAGTDGLDGNCTGLCVNGTDGVDGICTEPCVNGTNGADGTDGLDGVCIEPCVNGTDGTDGVDGDCTGLCVNGTDGVDGLNGSNLFDCSASPPCNCSSDVSCEGTTYLSPVDNSMYVCGCNGTGIWASVSEFERWGEESRVCNAGEHLLDDRDCNVDWGAVIGAQEPGSPPTSGLYLPKDIIITRVGFASIDPSCTGSGTFDVRICDTANSTIILYDESRCETLLSGLSSTNAEHSNSIAVQVPGDVYITWGINNSCINPGDGVDEWNVNFYYRWTIPD